MFAFKIIKEDSKSKARLGKVKTSHGSFSTPAFIPVATLATIRSLDQKDMADLGAEALLANTYHLHLRPGEKLIKKFGGLHKFMNWDKPIVTDSGGFQVFSLGIALEHGSSKVLSRSKNQELRIKHEEGKPRLNKITEEGVTLQSHLDGSKHLLTPEKSIKIQTQLGADLIVAFDDHESSKHTHNQMLESIELTEKWGLRSIQKYQELCHSR